MSEIRPFALDRVTLDLEIDGGGIEEYSGETFLVADTREDKDLTIFCSSRQFPMQLSGISEANVQILCVGNPARK